MTFPRLYHYACGLARYPVLLEGLLDQKVKMLTSQDELWYIPVDLDPEISLGHVKQYRYPTAVYGADPVWVTEIRYHRDLDMPWRRFVCCKELMHAFDSDAERTNSPDKFGQLLNEIESPLPTELQSAMYLTENRTKWMAILALCPKPVREHFRAGWETGEITEYEIALELQLPEELIPIIMSSSYDRVVDILIPPVEPMLELGDK